MAKQKKKRQSPNSTSSKGVMGRPETPISWQQVDSLLSIQCTAEEIAAVLGITVQTLVNRVKKEKGVTYLEYSCQKRAVGKSSLRRAQWMEALGQTMIVRILPDGTQETVQQERSRNASMLMFLGKNYLGQKNVWDDSTDRREEEQTAPQDPFKELAQVLVSFTAEERRKLLGEFTANIDGKTVKGSIHAQGNGQDGEGD